VHTLARGREIEYLSLSIYLSFFFVFLQGRELLLFKNSFFPFRGGVTRVPEVLEKEREATSLTFSCYPKWEEITRELLPAQTVTDRPDLVCVITIPFFLIIVFGG